MNEDYEIPFNCSPIDESVPKVQILVVDDDSSYLDYFMGLLNMLNYQVTPARDPIEALNILQLKAVSFDCVIADIYMPLMNGVELQQKIEDDFSIPVVLMSEVSDKQQLAIETGLQEGAMVINKPPLVEQVQNLWRYILIRMKAKNNFKGKRPIQGQSVEIDLNKLMNGNNQNEDPPNIDIRKRPKPKLIWTPALHDRFLDAMKAIGYDRAVPKKIMEHMNVNGLTRQQISSHLQKYRIYMRRIYDACMKIREYGVPFDWNQMMASLTWEGFPDLVHNSYLLNYATAMFMKEIEDDKNRTRFKRRRTYTQFGENNGMTMFGNGTNTSDYGIGLSPSSQGLGNLYTPYRPYAPLVTPISSNGTIGATSGVGSLYTPYRPLAPVTPFSSNGTTSTIGATSGVGSLYTPYRPIASHVTPTPSNDTIGATSGVGSLYTPYRPIASPVTPNPSNDTIGATSGIGSLYTPYQPIASPVTPTPSNDTIGATSGVGSLYTPYWPIASRVTPTPSNDTIGATSGVGSLCTPYRPISPLVTPTPGNDTIGATGGVGSLYTPYRPISPLVTPTPSNGTIGETSGVGSLYTPYQPISPLVTPISSNGTTGATSGVGSLYTPYRPISPLVTPIPSNGATGATSGVGSLYTPYRPISPLVTPIPSNGATGATSGVGSLYTPYRPISPLVTPIPSNGATGATSGVGSLYTPYRPISPLVSPIPSNGGANITVGATNGANYYHDIIGNHMRNNNVPRHVLENVVPNVGGYINNYGTGTQPQTVMTQGPFGYDGLHSGSPSNGTAVDNNGALFATPYQGLNGNARYFRGGIPNFSNGNNMMQQPSVGHMPGNFVGQSYSPTNSQLNYMPTYMNQHLGTDFMPHHTTPVPAAMPSYVASYPSTDPTTTRLSNYPSETTAPPMGGTPNFTLRNSFVSPMGEFFNLSQQPFSKIAAMINLSNGATTPLGAVWNHAALSSPDEANNGPLPLADLSDFVQQPGLVTDVVHISDDSEQAPFDVNVLNSVDEQPQPAVAAATSNMPNSVAQQPQVVSDDSDNLSNTSTGNQNMVTFAEQLAVGNQESNGSSASNDQQAQEMEGHGFNSGASNHLKDWLSDVYDNEYSMDPMDAVTAYLNTDPQIDVNNDPWLGEY